MRPVRLIGVLGTGTEVGKTWATARLLGLLRARGIAVAARKPVQSFAPDTGPTDAQQLAAASGEPVDTVCPPHRSYPCAMAPPMAADALQRATISLDEIVREIVWPRSVAIGFVETVGGARSPLAHDGDSLDLLQRLAVDDILLVADAGLGTINSVRLVVASIGSIPTTVLLNRYETTDDLHRRNRDWLTDRDGLRVITGCAAF